VRNVLKLISLSIVPLVLVLPAGIRADDPTLLIELPTGALPLAVNANGTLIVGNFRAGGGFYWMPTTGVISLGGDGAVESSRDGRTIVGNAFDARKIRQAAIWQRAAEWRLLGSIAPNAAPCDNLLSSSFGTSADGKVIVGLAWNGCSIARAFRWEESTGMVDLGSTVAGRSSRANGISGDGKVVLGWQEHSTGPRQGARWVNGQQELFAGPDGFVGEAQGANSDGSIVVGQTCRFTGGLDQSAWIWTAREGVQCMPVPRPRLSGAIGIMFSTSEDGRVIGGAHSFGLESEAVLWIDRSSVYLKDYLKAHGVPTAFDGWINTGFITGVSPDGRILVGYGAGPRDFQGYIVILGSTP
jgi:probable HAF family extracellular repeat protein